MIDFTTVIGVDRRHMEHLRLVWPTWVKFKPSLLKHPLVVFHDWDVYDHEIRQIVGRANLLLWPFGGVEYKGDPTIGRFGDPQREKMLSGFVHVPAQHVKTEYWLKLDLDAVAIGQDDWVDESWFEENPAIVSSAWSYTKPPTQMFELDIWAGRHNLFDSEPLKLFPEPGSDIVRHKRIISWCSFFRTDFSTAVSNLCWRTCGEGMLPVPSQDGVMWYCAQRMGAGIRYAQMKSRGWAHCSTIKSIVDTIRKHDK